MAKTNRDGMQRAIHATNFIQQIPMRWQSEALTCEGSTAAVRTGELQN
jgi:hypothetical protein